MKSFVLFILLNLTFINISANSAEIINSGESDYKSVRLTPEIYSNSNPDLSDIRVFDSKNETVPFFINSYENYVEESFDGITATQVYSFTKGNDYYYDYELFAPKNTDVITTSIKIETSDKNFAKNIDILGSFDNIRWKPIKTDTIYSVNNSSKLEIFFDTELRYNFFRFKINNNLEQISFDKIISKKNKKVIGTIYFIENLSPEYTIEQKGKKTVITLKNIRNLKLKEIMITANGNFKRDVSIPELGLYGMELYNFKFEDDEYGGSALELGGAACSENNLEIEIDNKDDKPIEIKGLDLKYYADEIVFKAENKDKYSVNFGADEKLQMPVYDIVSYKEKILESEIDKLIFDEFKIDNPYNAKSSNNISTFLINILIFVIMISLGFIIFSKLKKLK